MEFDDLDYDVPQTLLGEVEGLGRIYRINDSTTFPEYINIVGKDCVPSVREVAYARVFNEPLQAQNVTVREGVVYSPSNLPIVVPASFALDNPLLAAHSNREGMEFALSPKVFEQLLFIAKLDKEKKSPLERRAFFAPDFKDFTISRAELASLLPENLRTRYLNDGLDESNIEEFRQVSSRYLSKRALVESKSPEVQFAVSLLKDMGLVHAFSSLYDMPVKFASLDYVKTQTLPFVRQMNFNCLMHSSAVESNSRNFDRKEVRHYILRDR